MSELRKLRDSILERPDRFKKLKQEYRVFLNWAATVALWSTPLALMPQLVAVPRVSLTTWTWLACNSSIFALYALNQKGKVMVRVAEALLEWAVVVFILVRQ